MLQGRIPQHAIDVTELEAMSGYVNHEKNIKKQKKSQQNWNTEAEQTEIPGQTWRTRPGRSWAQL